MLCNTYTEICTYSHLGLGLTLAHMRPQRRDEVVCLAIEVVKLGLPEKSYRLLFHPLCGSCPISLNTVECLGHKKEKNKSKGLK